MLNTSRPAPEARLLCLLNLARLTDEDRSRALHLTQGVIDWRGFFELASGNSALILTCRRLRGLGLEPPGLDERDAQAQSQFVRGQARAARAREFLCVAAEQGISVIVLKGGMLGSVIYGDAAYKKMNDVDVLVRREDAPRLAAILRQLGYASVGQLLGRNEFAEDSHHCPPFVSPDNHCMVGIHWDLCSPYSAWEPDLGEIWRGKVAERVCGAPAFRMSWEENLLHLCIHLPFFKVGVRELSDVYNLVRFCEPGIDWERFDRLVERWEAEDAAYRVIALADALMPLGLPAEMLERWSSVSSGFTVADTQDRLRLGPALIATRSLQIARIEKAFSVFRLSGSYSERVLAWAMTWRRTFWPPALELPKLVARYAEERPSPWRTFKMRLLAGPCCWRALARDHGGLAVAAITAINVAIVLRDTLARPFRSAGVPIRQHPAAQLLEAME